MKILLGIIFVFIPLTTGLFVVKNEVGKLDYQYRSLLHEISKAEQDIKMLEAEWSYITSPKNIRSLADKVENVEHIDISQVKRISDISMRISGAIASR